MTCPIADQLRTKWYAVSLQLHVNSSEDHKQRAMKMRETKEYQDAKDELIDHISLCPECQKSWDHTTKAIDNEKMDVSVIYAKHVKQPVEVADDWTDI